MTDPTKPEPEVSVRDVQAWATEPARPGLVSVVIPVFDGAAFLLEALESVRAQRYPHWEVIVVDDGSTDASGSVARAVAEREPRVRVRSQPNRGHPAARNTGLVECRGEYLQFLDADDRLCPGKLESQVAFLEMHPEVDIVTGEARYYSARGREPTRELAPPLPHSLADLLLRNVMCVDSPLVRRTVLAKTGGFKSRTERGERLYGCEDWDLWLRAALAGCRLEYVPDVVVHNYWHGRDAQHDRVRMLESALWVLADNAGGVPFRQRPWWGLSVLEKRLALWVTRRADGTRAHAALRQLLATLCTLRGAAAR